jgi:hypothetical protein
MLYDYQRGKLSFTYLNNHAVFGVYFSIRVVDSVAVDTHSQLSFNHAFRFAAGSYEFAVQ